MTTIWYGFQHFVPCQLFAKNDFFINKWDWTRDVGCEVPFIWALMKTFQTHTRAGAKLYKCLPASPSLSGISQLMEGQSIEESIPTDCKNVYSKRSQIRLQSLLYRLSCCLVAKSTQQHIQLSHVQLSHVQLFCDPMDCSPPGSSVHGILQERILEWGAIPFSRGSSRPRN